MQKSAYIWEVVKKIRKSEMSGLGADEIVNILLENRGVNTEKKKRDFFEPLHPQKISLKDLQIDKSEVSKTVIRIRKAFANKEKVIIYGDYDADGVCATAILWECLYSYNQDVIPYIPNRFSEGYGINAESVKKLKKENPELGLIITVDNGIVARQAIDVANGLGIDVVINDHHQKEKKLPKAFSIVHTDKICGSAVAWVLAREILTKIKSNKKINNLELAAIGTIADQLPLLSENRSFAKYGLEELNTTKRPGLLALFEEAAIRRGSVGTYEVNYLIAPRINAMGRLEHAMDSLRLLCTTNMVRARELAIHMGFVNKQRQKIVDQVVFHARSLVQEKEFKGVIVLAHESYHEGVIGLAASKLVEEYYRPAIVISKGKEVSKASARSIAGFNIIENIRKLDTLILGGGGHPMAAGFSIRTDTIEAFNNEFEKKTSKLLTENLLTKKIKIDLQINFENISMELINKLNVFEPSGVGNPRAVFSTTEVKVLDAKTVGSDAKHLRLTMENEGIIMKGIAFGKGGLLQFLSPEHKIEVSYNLEENTWNGNSDIQLKIKDLKVKN